MTRIIKNLSEISANYDAVFCDLWGCLHNGVKPFAAAVTALETFAKQGGIVHLLTNSPRPASAVYPQLDDIGVARDLYQGITASGDASRAALASGAYGNKVFHIGPERDDAFFAGVDTEDFYQGIDVQRVPLNDADGVVCTGLFDDNTETPGDYTELLLNMKNRGLKMLCANPDIQVDRGTDRIYCAGAIAQAYNDMGGTAHNFGKPHPPIYDLARSRLNAIAGRVVTDKQILCIGDGINTDIHGAIQEDIDCLFVTGGLASAQTGTTEQPDTAKLNNFLQSAQLTPTYSIGHLR